MRLVLELTDVGVVLEASRRAMSFEREDGDAHHVNGCAYEKTVDYQTESIEASPSMSPFLSASPHSGAMRSLPCI